MKKLLVILIVCCYFNVKGQYKVLDAPFISEKIHVFEPFPMGIDFALDDQFYYKRSNDSSEVEIYLKNNPFYNLSYLYGEPEYARVRVFRTINLSENIHFTSNTKTYNLYNTNSKWYTYEDSLLIDSIEMDKDWEMDLHLPWWVRKFINLNITEFKNNPKPYTREKSALSIFDSEITRHINNEYVEVDKDGFLIPLKKYQPINFEIVPLNKLLYSALSKGYLMAYKDSRFTLPMTTQEWVNKTDSFKNYNGIRLKEDYFVDPITDRLTSALIGFSMLDKHGEEICWFYYPELRFALIDKGTFLDNKIMNYGYLFDEHYYKSTIDSLYGMSPSQHNSCTDDSFLLKLMPIVKTKIHSEETKDEIKNGPVIFKQNNVLGRLEMDYANNLPNGKYRAYHINGAVSSEGVMDGGSCSGVFKFYYPNGWSC